MSCPIVELKDICSLLTDGTHYTPPNVGKGIPFLTVKDVSEAGLDFQSCSRITPEEYQKANSGNSAPKYGDVLFSKDGTVGKVYVVKETEPFAVLSSLAILRPKENVDSNYLGYALKTPQALGQAAQNKTGSALRRIILSDIKTLKIPLPPLPEQKRIAAILDKADAIRRKRQQAIQLANDFLRALFLDSFNEKKGIETQCIGELCFVKGGKRLPAGHDYVDFQSGHPYLRVTDFSRGTISEGNLKYISNKTHKIIKNYTINSDDVFISIAGSIGISGVIPIHLDGANLTENAAKLVIRDKKYLSNEYLAFWLNTPEAQNQIKGKTMSTTQPKLALFRIEELQIPLPPVDEQLKFVAIKKKVNELVQKFELSAVNCSQSFNSLSQIAFAGQF